MPGDRNEVLVGAEKFDIGRNTGMRDEAVDRSADPDTLASQETEQPRQRNVMTLSTSPTRRQPSPIA
jgi:hypothetical protein